jgi:ribosomal protein S18 acetylase RimI-like enzyme
VPATAAASRPEQEEARGRFRLPLGFFLLAEALMSKAKAGHLSIRACRLEDIEVVLELWRQAEATPGVTDTADYLRRAIVESPAHVLVAEVAGRLVGSVIGAFDGWRGNIYRLAVHPDCRRLGIACALVAEVEKLLAGQGARRVTALVEKDHPSAMSFWEAVGYRIDERITRRVRTLGPAVPGRE